MYKDNQEATLEHMKEINDEEQAHFAEVERTNPTPAVSANAYYRPASASRGLGPVVRGRVRTGPPRRAYDDGSKETFSRRERPFIYTNEKGEALPLFTACLVNEHESRVVVQPIDHYVPEN